MRSDTASSCASAWVWGSAIAHQLSLRPGVRVVGTASTIDEALELARLKHPVVSLVDLMLAGDSGLRFVRTSQARSLATRSVIVTSEPTPWAISQAREAGAVGFVAKDDLMTGDNVWQVVEAVANGGQFYSETALNKHPIGPQGNGAAPTANPFDLTDQEVEMIRCFSRGMDTAGIARQLSIGHQTVRNKTRAIGSKLGVSGRLEIVSAALRLGIIVPPTQL